MRLKSTSNVLIIATVILGQMSSQALAQKPDPEKGVDIRVQRQYKRIALGLKNDKLTEQQANNLRTLVFNVESDVKSKREGNSGKLNAEQLKQVLNALSQNANQINTALGAGTSQNAGADALGPNWKPGKDGAQDPKALLKQMKKQEARELRQEKQANEQIIEQQQLDYEKEVISNLGQQKPAIQKKKNQLEEVRKENGAN